MSWGSVCITHNTESHIGSQCLLSSYKKDKIATFTITKFSVDQYIIWWFS